MTAVMTEWKLAAAYDYTQVPKFSSQARVNEVPGYTLCNSAEVPESR